MTPRHRAPRHSARMIALAALAVTAGCAALLSSAGPRFGRDAIKLPHARHKTAGVDCIVCHESIYDATTMEGKFLPPESKCLECHREQKTNGNCAFCHADAKRPATYAPREPQLRVSHAKHIELVKEDCSRCHSKLPEPYRSAEPTAPMRACLDCHDHQKEIRTTRCDACHIDLGRYPLQPITLLSHQGNYVAEHARDARAAATTCAQCHEQTFCTDCHGKAVPTRIELRFPERVDRNFIHRNDFSSRHAIEARFDAPSCQRCHGISFCDGCHRANNLTPTGTNPRNPHPPGYARPGATSHGADARRDAATCAACHDQGAASICVDCHRSGGIGGNPHPPGWSDRHPRREIAHNGMCGYCHS